MKYSIDLRSSSEFFIGGHLKCQTTSFFFLLAAIMKKKKEKKKPPKTVRPPSSTAKVLHRCLIAESGSRWLKTGVCYKKIGEKRGKKEQPPGPCFVIVWRCSHCDELCFSNRTQRATTPTSSLQQSGASCLFCVWLVGAASLSLSLSLQSKHKPVLLTWQTRNRKVLLWLKN